MKNKLSAMKNPDFISRQVSKGRYFFADLSQECRNDFRIVCAGKEHCDGSYFLVRDSFVYYAIEVITDGEWQLEFKKCKYALKAGSIFAYSPQTSYSLKCKSANGASKYFICFLGEKSQNLIDDCGLKLGIPLKTHASAWIYSLINQILDCTAFNLETSAKVGTALLKILFKILKDDLKISNGEYTKQSYESFLKCRNFIQENFKTISSISDISESCHMHNAYICRLFKKHYMQSPMDFLISLKINYSIELILRQNYNIKSAALEVGYKDPYHFSRVFKKVMGKSPRPFLEELSRNAKR